MVICISMVESGLFFSRQNDNQASLYQTWQMSHRTHIIKWASWISWNVRLLCRPWAIFTQGKFLHLQNYLYRMQSNHPLLVKNKLMLSRPCQDVWTSRWCQHPSFLHISCFCFFLTTSFHSCVRSIKLKLVTLVSVPLTTVVPLHFCCVYVVSVGGIASSASMHRTHCLAHSWFAPSLHAPV